MAILGCIAILIASIRWEFRGGVFAATLCSVLILAGYFTAKMDNSNIIVISITILLYYLMGIGIGVVLGITRKQRLNLILSEERNKTLILDLANEKERLNVTLASIGDGVIATEKDGTINIINIVASELTGWESHDAIGNAFWDVFNIINKNSGKSSADLFNEVIQKGNQIELESNTILISKKGIEKIIADSASPVKDTAGNILGIIVVFRDNTQKALDEERILYLSYHDSLTGLYNRSFFDEELKRLDTARQLPLSFIIGDVNGLKLVNDAFGHQEGDKYLKTIAWIIKESTRQEDIICRWGGDEFAIILPMTDEINAINIIERINKKCADSRQGIIPPSISLGCSTKNDSFQKTSDLLKDAEDKMYFYKMTEKRNLQGMTISFLKKEYLSRNYGAVEHLELLKKYFRELKKCLCLTDTEVEELELLSIYHDIGQISIPVSILNRAGPLNREEWRGIRKHPETGYHITASSEKLSYVSDYILTHHERWDGTGYPNKLKGLNIPRLSRIFFIVDSFVVITCPRPYKPKLSMEDAVDEIRSNTGTQFDPELVGIITEHIVHYKI